MDHALSWLVSDIDVFFTVAVVTHILQHLEVSEGSEYGNRNIHARI